MVDINARGNPTSPVEMTPTTKWALGALGAVLFALACAICGMVIQHGQKLEAIQETLGVFNGMLKKIDPYLSKTDIQEFELKQQQEKADQIDKHVDALDLRLINLERRPGPR